MFSIFYPIFTQESGVCMNTLQLHLLEESVTDYNKNLNPFIKQRKVEIRKENLKHLLTPLHFIKFGRSDYTQKMIKKCNEYQKAKQKKSPTKAFCIQFRNYLITSLTIDNGLRSPNVTELKVRQCWKDVQVIKLCQT